MVRSEPAAAPLPAPLDHAFRRVGTTPGQLCWAALTVVVLTGVALGVLYNPSEPLASVELIQEAVPFGWLIRATHRLAAQAFFVLLLLHTLDHVWAGSYRHLRPGTWWRLVGVLLLGLGGMFGGFLLRGDAEARAAHAIADSVTRLLPGLGDDLSALVWGRGTLGPVYVHHLVTFTLLPWLLAIDHARRSWAGWVVTAAVLASCTLAALVHHPGPGTATVASDAALWGPWYFMGLQELLRWWPAWLAAWVLPLLAVSALGALGHLSAGGSPAQAPASGRDRALRLGLLLAVVAYAGVTLAGWLSGGGA